MNAEIAPALARHGALNALPFYRGWTVVAAGFVCSMIAVGAIADDVENGAS